MKKEKKKSVPDTFLFCFKCRRLWQFFIHNFVHDRVWKFHDPKVLVLEGIFSSVVSNRVLSLEFRVEGNKYGLLL